MKYFNHLTICRTLTPEFTEYKYLRTIDPSKGPFSLKNQEWLENDQYIYTYENPMVKTVRVNVKFE